MKIQDQPQDIKIAKIWADMDAPNIATREDLASHVVAIRRTLHWNTATLYAYSCYVQTTNKLFKKP